MTRVHVLSTSARPDSVSRAAVPVVRRRLRELDVTPTVTDVLDLPPVWSAGWDREAYPPQYGHLWDDVAGADGVVFVSPVYCYSPAATTKTLQELLSGALQHKPVAVVMASSTARSHLVAQQLASALALDASALVLPGHVLLHEEDLQADRTLRPDPARRTEDLVDRFVAYVAACRHLRPVPATGR